MASNPLHLLPKPTSLINFPNSAKFLPHPHPKTFSISSSLSPPTSREQSINQARSILSSSLQKSLKNPLFLPSRKLKNNPQPRFRIEIPISDECKPSSLISLAAGLFSPSIFISNVPNPNILLIWSSSELLDLARQDFASANSIFHCDLTSAGDGDLESADLGVFLAPDASMLGEIGAIVDCLSLRSVVLVNPKWGFEEERDFDGKMRGFVGSFDVVYSLMVLEVKGLLSRRKGAVFKAGRDEDWMIMVEDEGDLRVVSRFRRRPEIGEVENVLYNLMAANSPITKSVKFFRDLVSGVARKKD